MDEQNYIEGKVYHKDVAFLSYLTCERCGAIVSNRETHTNWHDSLDNTIAILVKDVTTNKFG